MAHILVVDDDPQIRVILSTFVTKMGHHVAVAADGKEALQHLTAHRVDLILLDIIMPEQDGIGTILEVMKLEERPAIIVISGGSLNLDIDFIQTIVKKLPVEDILTKPISFDVLGAAVEKALSAQGVS